MRRRDLLVYCSGMVGLAGCLSTPSETDEETETPTSAYDEADVEACERAHLDDRYDGSPSPAVTERRTRNGWVRFTVESEWGYTDDSGETPVHVDHYVQAFYYVRGETVYRGEDQLADPPAGREMDC